MSVLVFRHLVGVVSVAATAGALAVSPASASPSSALSPASAASSYTWQDAALPAGASQCVGRSASARGTQYILQCGQRHHLMQGSTERPLGLTAGAATFSRLELSVVSDSGWVYGAVGHGDDEQRTGWRLARWTPTGTLQLAPTTPASGTHRNLSEPFSDSTSAYVSAVNERGDGVVQYFSYASQADTSSWMWPTSGNPLPVMPVQKGRRAVAKGIADDGTVVFNDVLPGNGEFASGQPYRRLPDGTSAALPAVPGFGADVALVSPSGQHLVGHTQPTNAPSARWVRWDGPTFTPTTMVPPLNHQSVFSGVTNTGDVLVGNTLVRGSTVSTVTDHVTGAFPPGSLYTVDITEDGRLLALTWDNDNDQPLKVGWLVPTR